MSNQRKFTGHSGQMAVMAEVLFRQCNAATPQVDIGTDVFAFHDEREEVARIQVKTEQGERYKKEDGYSAVFRIPLKQLERPDKPPLYYALAVRLEGQYVAFLVIGRARLSEYWNGTKKFGTKDEGNLALHVQFRERVICGDVDLTEYRDAWEILPPLQSLPIVKEVHDEAVGKDQGVVGAGVETIEQVKAADVAARMVEESHGDDLPPPAVPAPTQPPEKPPSHGS